MLWTSQTGWRGGGGAQREETEEHRKAVSVERLVRGEHWPAQTDDLPVAYRGSGGVQRRQSRRILSEDASQVVTTWIWSFNVSV